MVSPPISRTSRLAIERPSPVPPTREALPSCVNASNTPVWSDCGDARAGVGDAEKQPALVVAHVVESDAHLHFTSLGVLDGIREQVAEHLAQAQQVADHAGRHGGLDPADHLDLLAFGTPRVELRSLLGKLADVERFADQLHLAGFDLRVVEDVVDDLHHRFGRAAHRVDEAPLAFVEIGAGQQLGHAEHAVHRRADLVTHVGEEVVLGPRQQFSAPQACLEFAGALDDLLARRCDAAYAGHVRNRPAGSRGLRSSTRVGAAHCCGRDPAGQGP